MNKDLDLACRATLLDELYESTVLNEHTRGLLDSWIKDEATNEQVLNLVFKPFGDQNYKEAELVEESVENEFIDMLMEGPLFPPVSTGLPGDEHGLFAETDTRIKPSEQTTFDNYKKIFADDVRGTSWFRGATAAEVDKIASARAKRRILGDRINIYRAERNKLPKDHPEWHKYDKLFRVNRSRINAFRYELENSENSVKRRLQDAKFIAKRRAETEFRNAKEAQRDKMLKYGSYALAGAAIGALTYYLYKKVKEKTGDKKKAAKAAAQLAKKAERGAKTPHQKAKAQRIAKRWAEKAK